jgi:hypothetical protein
MFTGVSLTLHLGEFGAGLGGDPNRLSRVALQRSQTHRLASLLQDDGDVFVAREEVHDHLRMSLQVFEWDVS